MIAPEKMLNFLKAAHNDFQRLTEQVKFDKTHSLHRTLITLYGSIFELTGSVILLVDNKLTVGVPILLRSILEAYVDLLNLNKDSSYGYYLEASCLKEWLKLLKDAKTGNELLASLASIPNEIIDNYNFRQKELQQMGYRVLRIDEKFKRADMHKEYNSVYNMLCSDSHNNISSLIRRHIEVQDEDFSIIFYKNNNLKDSAMHIAFITEYFVRTTELIHEFFNSPVQVNVSVYRGMLNKMNEECEKAVAL